MDWWNARREIRRLYLRWMRNVNSVDTLDVTGMLESMTRELRYRRAHPESCTKGCLDLIVEERQMVKAVLRAYPDIGRVIV